MSPKSYEPRNHRCKPDSREVKFAIPMNLFNSMQAKIQVVGISTAAYLRVLISKDLEKSNE